MVRAASALCVVGVLLNVAPVTGQHARTIRRGPHTAPRSPLSTITVRVYNLASVDPGELARSLEIVTSVFARAHVGVRWALAEPEAGNDLLFDVIITKGSEHSLGASPRLDVLGQAFPRASRAYAYYDRISNAANSFAKGFRVGVLAEVVSHELGHLLLPDGHHAVRGIMRPGLGMRPHVTETFQPKEAKLVQRRLEQRMVGRRVIPSNPPIEALDVLAERRAEVLR